MTDSWALISKQVEVANNRAAVMARNTDVMLTSPALLNPVLVGPAIQKQLMLKLALFPVTTRIVLRKKKAVRLCTVGVKTRCRAMADVVLLNCESFTRCSHPHFDNNSFHRVALIFVGVLLRHN